MFKRLAKARRHSADEVGASLPPTPLDEPPGNVGTSNKFLDVPIHQAFNPAILRGSRFKYARRSCGDATAIQSMILTDETGIGTRVGVDNDYQTVTAVPAFIVEHEPEKARGLGVWGRRMSKKIESFRRVGSRESICALEREDTVNNNNHESNNNNTDKSPENRKNDGKLLSRRSPSPFKSFFIRMGSTGMLNSTKTMRRSSNCDDRLKTTDKETLFRSCSTSQLNTSPTYVKGDDPSEGIDLQIAHRKDKTMSCDNLVDNHDDDVFEGISMTSSSRRSSSSGFGACDFNDTRNDALRKSSSCDFKETKRCNFPYAFLRSKLSVLPEERNGPPQTKEDRLFKATSEEHFPVLKIDESFDGTTTLGRRRSKHSSGDNPQTPRFSRNSYAEYRGGRASSSLSKCDPDRYSLNPSNLERMEDTLKREERCYSPFMRPPRTVQPTLTESSQETSDYTQIDSYRLSETSSLGAELDVIATLRNHRRNSAPCPEQRLSSHYVSSNESGYDSDGGGRGESTATFENETLSLKCTDSSDTSSVIDSELEKPMRSSTPSECRDVTSNLSVKMIKPVRSASDMNEGIDGLRWHQSTSGRLLPSIHQGSYDDTPSNRLSLCSDSVQSIKIEQQVDCTPPHRVRLQQDKTRFLSDIIQPPRRVRRCRVVQLARRDGKDSLGIRLAQQNVGEMKYIVVQLENDGIAHRDGRLRLGDEIVEVEGKELRTLKTLEEVQEFLKSFTGNKVRLTTAYEETVPEGYTETTAIPKEYEHLENAKNLSNASQMDNQRQCDVSGDRVEVDNQVDSLQRKRPNYLPLTCVTKTRKDPVEPTPDADQYLTRHVARFEKGIGKPSLGFSVVGGRDSPRGEMGIFVRRVFPGGQADSSKALFQGDEILSLNGKQLRGCTHQEVIELFKAVREGVVELEIARRHRYPKTALKSAPY
ncbi:uncharacterized protein LOC107036504 isoform X1 [Diachasma alloeum]|uniref:uncharacterized protein LOC107036504 isoform X1 n=2 Tax=Diachasma alloeum TaxID=454923 RepID=UPI0007382D29|nr:uncharacterized protein LOC107036504 isoform X1 [Diachasma alloeum]